MCQEILTGVQLVGWSLFARADAHVHACVLCVCVRACACVLCFAESGETCGVKCHSYL